MESSVLSNEVAVEVWVLASQSNDGIEIIDGVEVFVGVPARRIGWMGKAGVRLGEYLRCPLTGTQYRLDAAGTLAESR